MHKNVEADRWRALKTRLRMFGLNSPLPGQLSGGFKMGNDSVRWNLNQSRGCPSGVGWAFQLWGKQTAACLPSVSSPPFPLGQCSPKWPLDPFQAVSGKLEASPGLLRPPHTSKDYNILNDIHVCQPRLIFSYFLLSFVNILVVEWMQLTISYICGT